MRGGNNIKAVLVLEDGKVFKGQTFAGKGEIGGEIVFNTSMMGYQEILTDPSYKGQIVTMTYPMIGNYGINYEDEESNNPQVEAFVVREYSQYYSNWRSKLSLKDYLERYGVMGIEGIDTRALTKHIRKAGAMKAYISTEDYNYKHLINKAKSHLDMLGRDLVKEVTCLKEYSYNQKGDYHVLVIDFGVKKSILNNLAKLNCKVTVVPAQTKAEDILAKNPDGIFLSNGPGDPAAVTYAVEELKKLLGKKPIFGICFGHQILAQAFELETYKLKFGHRGGNHPVKNFISQQVEISSQNHGFCVKFPEKKKEKYSKDIEVTHLNLNDNTIEGLRHKELKCFSVQYHPEAAPGPFDSRYLFKEFIKLMN